MEHTLGGGGRPCGAGAGSPLGVWLGRCLDAQLPGW